MNARLVCVLFLAVSISCHGEEVGQAAGGETSIASPTLLDKWNELMRQAIEHTAPKVDYGKPRKVKHGAVPEIVFKGTSITIDGKLVQLRGPLEEWKAAIPGEPRCKSRKNDIAYCVWDELGIFVGTGRKRTDLVKFFNIRLKAEPVIEGATVGDHLPKGVFRGYLELDGYGIDAETKFWEVRSASDPKRNLRCGLEDCSHPHGRFDEESSLYLGLYGASEKSTILEFSVSSSE